MDYGRLGKTEPHGGSSRSLPDLSQPATLPKTKRKFNLKLVLILTAVLLLASAIAAGLTVALSRKSSSRNTKHATQAISHACSHTLYPSLCMNTLVDFPGALTATDQDLVQVSVNMTLSRFGKALDVATEINNVAMDPHARSAYDDCLELLEDSIDLLAKSLNSVGNNGDATTTTNTHDVLTWLSSSLTNQDTCEEGMNEVPGGNIRDQMLDTLKDLSELVSNSLAIFAASGNDFSGIPINNRRLLTVENDKVGLYHRHDNFDGSVELDGDDFPTWLSSKDRKLLGADISTQQADIIVAKDGTGTYKTIAEAIKKVPEHSSKRVVIYVKAGRYEEDKLKVGRKKTNVMFVGEGKGKTIITGSKNVGQKMTTFHTATFAATGAGFMAKDITFENTAGPGKHQAVALRVGGDHAVIYRCSIIGYQDTLYVHSNRQFYRECDIYGTVDFIFGNAVVVLQSCAIYARKPMPNQKNTITAQNRKDPNQNTGISIHTCKLTATNDLEAAKGSFPTYLGRPWKLYSRTVYMETTMGDHIHQEGWLPWSGTFALNTLYYGEYMNSGPGAGTAERVKWPGYHIMSKADASKFTVGQFILGSAWLPSTGVAFQSGLQP